MEHNDIELLVSFINQKLGSGLKRELSNEYYYQSLTLAAIDAVFSVQARYPSVQAVVQRYCKRYGLDIYREQKECLPLSNSQEHITTLIQKLEQDGISYFAENVFCNRSQTAGRLKVTILLDLLRVVSGLNIQTFQDIQPWLSSPDKQDALLKKITSIHGVGEATSRYFLMLSGDDRMVKPDRMILRFIRNALKRTVSQIDAVRLIQEASDCLSKTYQDMSPRRLDYLIWSWQRDQSISKDTDASMYVIKQRLSTSQPNISKSNNILTVPQKIQQAMRDFDYKPGDLLSSSQIKDAVLMYYPSIARGSVMPADYCCNKWNKDPRSGIYHIFFYEEIEGKYRLLPSIDLTRPRERGVCDSISKG